METGRKCRGLCGLEKPLTYEYFAILKYYNGLPVFRGECIKCLSNKRRIARNEPITDQIVDQNFIQKYHTLMLNLQGQRKTISHIAEILHLNINTVKNYFQQTNLRQCYTCKQIKQLNKDNFSIHTITYCGITIFHGQCKKCRNKINKPNTLSTKIRRNISIALHDGLNNNNLSKQQLSTFDILDYTLPQLIHHLTSRFEWWMTKDNYGSYCRQKWQDNTPSTWKWNIDHIISQSILPYSDINDKNFRQCWALDNLRPYSAKQNLKDGCRSYQKSLMILDSYKQKNKST